MHLTQRMLDKAQNEGILADCMDAEATVGDSFPRYYDSVYAEIDAEIRI